MKTKLKPIPKWLKLSIICGVLSACATYSTLYSGKSYVYRNDRFTSADGESFTCNEIGSKLDKYVCIPFDDMAALFQLSKNCGK